MTRRKADRDETNETLPKIKMRKDDEVRVALSFTVTTVDEDPCVHSYLRRTRFELVSF